jgi:hypothetical protein
VLLLCALLMHTGYTRAFKRLAVENGGAKRVYAGVNLCSAIATLPIAIVILIFADVSFHLLFLHLHLSLQSPPSTEHTYWLTQILYLVIVVLCVRILSFYAETASQAHLSANVFTQWAPGK